MFVRVQEEDASILYECGKAEFTSSDRSNHVALQMEGVPEIGPVTRIIHKGKGSVYFMNNDGQTIDMYDWPVHDTKKDDKEGNRIYTGDEVEVFMVDGVPDGEGQKGGHQAWILGRAKKQSGRFVIDFEDTEVVSSKDLGPIKSSNLRIV